MSYNQEPGAEELGALVADVAMISVAAAGISAYKNHYDRTGDRWGAIYQGLLTARRWWVWAGALIIGIGLTGLMLWSMYWLHYITPRTAWITNFTPNTSSGAMVLRNIAVYVYSWLVMGVIYCRNIDSGLHQRRWVYRRMHWLYVKTQQVPSFWLYLSLPFFQLF